MSDSSPDQTFDSELPSAPAPASGAPTIGDIEAAARAAKTKKAPGGGDVSFLLEVNVSPRLDGSFHPTVRFSSNGSGSKVYDLVGLQAAAAFLLARVRLAVPSKNRAEVTNSTLSMARHRERDILRALIDAQARERAGAAMLNGHSVGIDHPSELTSEPADAIVGKESAPDA